MVDRILQSDHFDADDWLQTFVVALVARHWSVLEPPRTDLLESSHNGTSATTGGTVSSPVVRTTPLHLMTTDYTPESPLNLCDWQGLSCDGDGRLMSLQWSKYYQPNGCFL